MSWKRAVLFLLLKQAAVNAWLIYSTLKTATNKVASTQREYLESLCQVFAPDPRTFTSKAHIPEKETNPVPCQYCKEIKKKNAPRLLIDAAHAKFHFTQIVWKPITNYLEERVSHATIRENLWYLASHFEAKLIPPFQSSRLKASSPQETLKEPILSATPVCILSYCLLTHFLCLDCFCTFILHSSCNFASFAASIVATVHRTPTLIWDWVSHISHCSFRVTLLFYHLYWIPHRNLDTYQLSFRWYYRYLLFYHIHPFWVHHRFLWKLQQLSQDWSTHVQPRLLRVFLHSRFHFLLKTEVLSCLYLLFFLCRKKKNVWFILIGWKRGADVTAMDRDMVYKL